MKRFILVLLLFVCCLFPMKGGVSFAESEKLIINTSFSYLYKDPSMDEHFDFKIKSGEVLNLLREEGNFYFASYEFEEVNYQGYIPFEFASIYTPEQENILVYNGKILNETTVFEVTSDESLGITLNPGHEIYIYEGFDSKKDYTSIKFTYENQVYTGRVLTKDLSPNGVNKGVIISLSIISALVGVILILLGLKTAKKKKWHKKLKTEKK